MTNAAKNFSLTSADLAEKLNDSSIDRVMAIDTSWNIIAWNKTSEELSGFLKKDLIGKNLLEIFPILTLDKEMTDAFSHAFLGYKSFLHSAPGLFNRHHIENHFIPLRNDNEEIIGVMNIMHDVSHRIKVEKQLIRLNTALEKKYVQLEKANNDIATFTFVAGHDIKGPIRNVYTGLEMLARNEGRVLSNTSRGGIRKMQASLNRINLLLDDILTIAQIGQYNVEFTSVDLNRVLEEVKRKTTEKLSSPFTINSAQLPVVNGSEEMLTYLFQQLLHNAIKFQVEGNHPVIDIRCSEVIAEDIPGSPEAYYEITITDNGIGFEKEESENIFNMFTRLHKETYRGSGIGLTISKRIMDVHEGLITAEGTPGNGATFKCYFPISK